MEDEAFEAPCMKEGCVNARDNLQMLLRDTRQRANELNNYSKVLAEAETLRLKLASVDAILQEQTQRSIEAVNGKEIAEANYKQLQSDWEFLRRKSGLLEEKADDADRHKEQANHWRSKYDEMCCLAEKLEANNIDIKSKYEATVKTLGVVGKKTVSYQNQIAELKTAKNDAAQKTKKLDKYLKTAIQAIDSLSQSVNLAKQSKTVRDMVNVFRRDDVRLFFNADPYKQPTSSGAEPSTSSQQIPDSDGEEDHEDAPEDVTSSQPPQDDSMLLASGRRLSDSEEDEMAEDGGDEDDAEVRKLESMLTKHVMKKETKNPEFASKMNEMSARKSAPRMVSSNNIKKWPAGIRKPETVDSGGLLNPKRTHSRQVPTCDFDAIANATEARKRALLGKTTADNSSGAASSSGPAPSGGTIHGKKGKTVREQQAEMMKESVKEKAARMKAEAAAGKTEAKPEAKPAVTHRRTSPQRATPPRTRLRSFMMSERGSDDSGDEEVIEKKEKEKEASEVVPSTSGAPVAQKPGRPRRSSSAYPGSRNDDDEAPKTPRKRMQSTSSSREPPPTPIRRSSRISSHVATEEVASEAVEMPTPRALRSASRAASRATSRATSRASSRRPSPTPSTSSTRGERARARSVLRGDLESSEPSNLIAAAVRLSESVTAKRRVMIEMDDEEEEELQLTTTKVVKKEEVVEKTGDVLKRNLGLAKRRAAPAPIDVGPPIRTRGMGKMKAPVVVKKTSDDSKFGDVSSSSNESVLQLIPNPYENEVDFEDALVFDRAAAGADPVQPSTSQVSEVVEEVEKPSEGVSKQPEDVAQTPKEAQQPEVVRTLSEASSDSGDIVTSSAAPAPASAPEAVEPIPTTKTAPEVPLTISIAESSTPQAVDSIPEVKKTPSQPLLQTRRPSAPPKSPQHQIMIDQLGLNLSDSESEGEEEEKPTSSTAVTMESTEPLVEVAEVPESAPSFVEDAPPGPESALSAPESAPTAPEVAPSTTEALPLAPEEPPSAPEAAPSLPDSSPSAPKVPHQAPPTSKSTAAPAAPPQRFPLPMQTVSSESITTSTSSNFSTPLNPQDDLLADIISGAHMTKKASVSKTSAIRGRRRAEQQEAPSTSKIVKAEEAPKCAPAVKKEDGEDEMASILSGAKVTAPRVSTRRTPPTPAKTPSAKAEPKASQEPKPGPQKRPAPPTSSASDGAGPAPKRQYTRKTPGIQVIDAIPLTRRRSSVRVALSRAASEESSMPTSSETQKPIDCEPTTSSTVAKKPGPTKTMLIDVPSRPHGKAIRQEQKSTAVKSAGERGGKRVDKNKAHFRQALDLKVGINELKRQMEDKGIFIADSIPLTPSDAVDVMMEFLRESSPADMWAVLMRQKLDGNVTPLVNTEEQNFLQVSATLIAEDNTLLELFIKRTLYELSLRDSIDAKQCGRLVRLFCHAIKFVQLIPSEDSEDVPEEPEDIEAVLDAKRCTWMRSLFLMLLYQNPTQFPKAFAYCLISDMSAYCQLLVDELEKPATSSELNVAIRLLMHRESDQAAVINWLLNTKFELANIPPLAPEDIQSACQAAHRQFVEEDVGGLKTSLFLAKTGDSEVLKVAFCVLQDHMALVEKQFLNPKEKDIELKHRTAYSVPTVATKMSASEAHSFNRVVEWEKMMLLIMIDNPISTHYQPIMKALTVISPQIVSFREIVESSDIEQFVDTSGVESLRESVQHFLELTSEFTNYPLRPSTLKSSDPSTSSK